MRKLVFTLLVFLGLSYGFSLEEFLWIFYWFDYDCYLWRQDREAYRVDFASKLHSREKIIPMPVLTEEHPRAAVELDGLVEDAMRKRKSLDWALVNLKPSTGPAASLPDSVRRCMLYYLYHDNFCKVEKPWDFGNNVLGDHYFSGGTGTLEQGWVRYVCVSVWTMDGLIPLLDGYTGISWARTSDTVMDSTRTMRMFNDAVQKNVLMSRLSNPAWSSILSMDSCTFHERYELAAFCMEVRLEYDCCETYPDVYRKTDTLFLATFIVNDYEYLIFSSVDFSENGYPWNTYIQR
jgi:hypothetical protein